jgi:N-acyl amino acid synthase FeeM
VAGLPRNVRAAGRQVFRAALAILPRKIRFAVFRQFVNCDPAPSPRLVLKIAETREELEACFRVLHDAYVQEGFMKPDPSGMRVTIYHALPTTTTLLAKFDDEVVGTISLVRESALGFPMQKIFHLGEIRHAGGNIAEVSSLAVTRRWQRQGGAILFPLMKFMYEYTTRFFDTRHLVIAVNPNRIGLYEAILFFKRLKQNQVDHYDFVNGAPAIGAHLDLKLAPGLFRRCYNDKPDRRNLYGYFVNIEMPNIHHPDKRFFTTTDPVMTPELLDYFFNQRTSIFAHLSDREKRMLHAIYDLPAYQHVLPLLPSRDMRSTGNRRKHRRFSVNCPGEVTLSMNGKGKNFKLKVVDCSGNAFRARAEERLPVNVWGEARIELGHTDHSLLWVRVMRETTTERTYVVEFDHPDEAWLKFVNALRKAATNTDLGAATSLMD